MEATRKVYANGELNQHGTLLDTVTFGQRRMRERESTEALLSTYEVDRYMGLMGLDIPNTPFKLKVEAEDLKH